MEAIFRKKKSKPTTTTPPQSAPTFSQQFDQQQSFSSTQLSGPQSDWSHISQQPYPQHQPNLVPNGYLATSPQLLGPQSTGTLVNKYGFASTNDLPSLDHGVAQLQLRGNNQPIEYGELYNLISSKFNVVVTSIDEKSFSGDEGELAVHTSPKPWQQQPETGQLSRELIPGRPKAATNNLISSTLISINYSAKVNLYANSKLPLNLPPMKM